MKELGRTFGDFALQQPFAVGICRISVK